MSSSSAFQPSLSVIQSISQGATTTVTFTAPCNFVVGEVVSFRVSQPSGMQELNNKQTTVTAVTSNTITVNIDSTNFTPFIFVDENHLQYAALVLPSASGIIPNYPLATVTLQDAFDNVPLNTDNQ